MGGGTTEMSETTRNVLIEAATFDPITIARSARRHKLPSEASKRFERGVDPLLPLAAARRVADLMVALAGGTLTEEGGALFAEVDIAGIDLPAGFVSGLIGVDYTDEEIVGALQTIGAEVVAASVPEALEGSGASGTGWVVIPPSWRPDLTDKWTLAEEVARIHGLDRIPSILPTPPSGRGLTALQQGRRRVANALAAAGLVETPAFPFTTQEQNDLHGSASGGTLPGVRLTNPLDGQAPYLRRSLIPGLLQTAHRNIARGLVDLALFETGVVFLPEPGVVYGTDEVPPLGVRPSDETLAALNASIPPQARHVAALFAGHVSPRQPGRAAEDYGLSEALDAVRVIAEAAGVADRGRTGQPCRAAPWSHRRAAGARCRRPRDRLETETVEVGYVGELHPQVSADADLPGRAVVLELDLDRVLDARRAGASSRHRCRRIPLPRRTCRSCSTPASPPPRCAPPCAEGALRRPGALLESVRLVDDYRGRGGSGRIQEPDASRCASAPTTAP